MSGPPEERDVRFWTGRSKRRKNKSLYKLKQLEKQKRDKEKKKEKYMWNKQ